MCLSLDNKIDCSDIRRSIEQSSDVGYIVWPLIKPLIHGKILYAPATPVSNAIIAKVDSIESHQKKNRSVKFENPINNSEIEPVWRFDGRSEEVRSDRSLTSTSSTQIKKIRQKVL